MIHPPKKPMEGVSKEDGEALAGMPENIPPRQPPELFQNDFYFVNYNEMTVVHSNKPYAFMCQSDMQARMKHGTLSLRKQLMSFYYGLALSRSERDTILVIMRLTC